ncbi:HEPN domain-containing protein [Candidatus Microgenomates bacterium]|nr:HEPN domain-containing protein [Candidatus Microgenomates bacterium]
MAHELLVKEWLYKANQDFGFAKISLQEERAYFDQICFFFHQAAEKYLKAYIVKFDLKFKKEHNLVRLLKICEEKDSSFASLEEDGRFLTKFYFEARYPEPVFATYSLKEAEEAFSSAQQIAKFVKDKLDVKRKITLEELKRENEKIDKILKRKLKKKSSS